ncbi:MAG: hypothetical protein DYH03_02440 [Nitrospira sp. NTP1]|nr:hypothetical protein [Nitrospira sp. NTP1]
MIVRMMLAAVGTLAVVLSFGSGHAQDVPADPSVKPPFVVASFSSIYGSTALPSPLGGGTVSLVGEPDSKTFGVSFNGTLTASASLTGKEKLVASLYIKCDGQEPGSRVTVGTVDLGVLKPAQPARAVMAIGEATAFVPLASIKCVSLALRIDEPDKTPSFVKTFTNNEIEIAEDVTVLNSTVRLIGEPDSKSFGLSYRGTLQSAIELSGDATLVAHLYMKCENDSPDTTSAIHVGTAKMGEVPKGRGESLRIMSADVTAFVPLREVECIKLGLQ